jgi:hypothetical protein
MGKKTQETIKSDARRDETNIITTIKVKEIMEKEKLALQLKRTEKLWFNNLEGVRRRGIKFAMTHDEIEEYIKCKLSVYYFAEHYCKIKLEDGTVGQMKLRDYQKDIIKLYTENRYSILMASRQVGKCLTFNALVNIMDENGRIFRVNLGKIYYENIRKYRKLTFLEKIKIFLYNLLEKIG